MDPITAGASRYYEYDMPPGTAGTYWYHPHPHYVTAAQVLQGLAGPLIVRARDDPLAHLPETLLFVTGLRLDADATISAEDTVDWNVGRQREMLLVNGGRHPVHTVRSRLDAALSRHQRDGIAPFPARTRRTPVDARGNRRRSARSAHSRIAGDPRRARATYRGRRRRRRGARRAYSLRALRYQTDSLGLGSYEDDVLLTLATSAETPAAPDLVPPSLREIADLGAADALQRVELEAIYGMCTRTGATIAFLINGARFDPARVDLVTTAGRVDLWDVVNRTGMAHPFHIHGTQFQLVSRRKGAIVTPAPYLAWIDTVVIPANETATIKVRQTLPGKRMFHCHILEHEDACTMAILDVRPV